MTSHLVELGIRYATAASLPTSSRMRRKPGSGATHMVRYVSKKGTQALGGGRLTTGLGGTDSVVVAA